MADVSNRNDCMTVLLTNLHSEMKDVQEKGSIMGVRSRMENLSLAITVWHHSCQTVIALVKALFFSVQKY